MTLIIIPILILIFWSVIGVPIFIINTKAAIRNNKHVQLLIIAGPITWMTVSFIYVINSIEKYFNAK